jgi:Trypsin
MRSHSKLAGALGAALAALAQPAVAMAPEIGIDCASCQFPTAVRLPLCSGVYMGHGLVLTAAHCVANVSENSNAYFGESDAGWELAVPIDHCVTHPDGEYDTNVWGEDSWSGVDLAYCVLAEDVPMPPIVPPMMPAGCERDWLAHEVYETPNHALATAVGAGCGIHQEYVGQDCEDGTKRFAGQQLVRQTQHLGSPTKLELKRDFFGDPDDTGLRSGDSGGPLFVRLPDDTLRLVGVIHGTSGDVAYAEAVPPYLHWIESSSGIDVTPHHAFVNGAWVTEIGEALLPRSEETDWFGDWQYGCAGAPMKVSESYTEAPFLATLQCPGWPALPDAFQVAPSPGRKHGAFRLRRNAGVPHLRGSLAAAVAPAAASGFVWNGDAAAPLAFLPVDPGGAPVEALRARAKRARGGYR